MPGKSRILVVGDESGTLDVLRGVLRREGYRVRTVTTADEALGLLRAEPFDLMLLDLGRDGAGGAHLLQPALREQARLPVVVLTPYAAVEPALEAVRGGLAFGYVCKPFRLGELLDIVRRALAAEHGAREESPPGPPPAATPEVHFGTLVGDHPLMHAVYRAIRKVAPGDSTVLILGESGTGKELVARAIHACSRRSGRPFVAINCAALPETLLESELFGHVKGAFTGATRHKEGLFVTADGGTLLLDEVGAIPVPMQQTLLRVLQEQEVRPVGGTRCIPVNVRIVAATNENLEDLIRQGRFREDLYYRLSVIPLELPPLRERRSDIPLLTWYFLRRLAEAGGPRLAVAPDVLAALGAHDWPGNVRELENVLSRAAALCDGDTLTLELLPQRLREAASARAANRTPDASAAPAPAGMTLRAFLREQERAYLRQALRQHGGNKEAAARALGISLATFYRKYDGASEGPRGC